MNRSYSRHMTLSALVLAVFLQAGCASTGQTAETPAPSGLPAEPEQAATQGSDTRSAEVTLVEQEPLRTETATVYEAGRFDNGKMWTFDNPPLDYFADEYGISPDSAWFERARLGALRIPGCSASFVSPHGLVMTNHHCARESVVEVSRDGEQLLDNGFYAASIDEERPIDEMYADQLIDITDVTGIVEAPLQGLSAEERSEQLAFLTDSLRQVMLDRLGGEDAGYEVEIIGLYNGAQHSAYTFRRYEDVRLVMAPELQIGYFGGDPDNFTYPRYNLDVSFLRVYQDDQPFVTTDHFSWSRNGTADGQPVFVIGNPGTTNRLQTVAELEYRRDHEEPMFLNWMKDRLAILRDYAEMHPDEAEEMDLVNTMFSMENQIKAQEGTLRGLRNEKLMGRRRDAENDFLEAAAGKLAAASPYADLFDEMQLVLDQMVPQVPQLMSFLVNPDIEWVSSVLNRAVMGFLYAYQLSSGVPEAELVDLRASLLSISDKPAQLEIRLLDARLEDMVGHLGNNHPAVQGILSGRTPEAAAQELVGATALVDSARFATIIDQYLESGDPSLVLARQMAIGYINYAQAMEPLSARRSQIAAELGRARYEVYGTELPPDATFSLRIADGRVAGYDYNGTVAPPFTTFYGLYDRYFTHRVDPWLIPERWGNPSERFDLSTPLNLVTTNDIIGGNSGSPVLNTDLEVVGLIFDGNIEGLPGDFIYTDEAARAVAVDSRGIIEALDDMYGADRIVLELLRGEFVESEAEADEGMPE